MAVKFPDKLIDELASQYERHTKCYGFGESSVQEMCDNVKTAAKTEIKAKQTKIRDEKQKKSMETYENKKKKAPEKTKCGDKGKTEKNCEKKVSKKKEKKCSPKKEK